MGSVYGEGDVEDLMLWPEFSCLMKAESEYPTGFLMSVVSSQTITQQMKIIFDIHNSIFQSL